MKKEINDFLNLHCSEKMKGEVIYYIYHVFLAHWVSVKKLPEYDLEIDLNNPKFMIIYLRNKPRGFRKFFWINWKTIFKIFLHSKN